MFSPGPGDLHPALNPAWLIRRCEFLMRAPISVSFPRRFRFWSSGSGQFEKITLPFFFFFETRNVSSRRPQTRLSAVRLRQTHGQSAVRKPLSSVHTRLIPPTDMCTQAQHIRPHTHTHACGGHFCLHQHCINAGTAGMTGRW